MKNLICISLLLFTLQNFASSKFYAVKLKVYTTKSNSAILENVKVTLDDGINKQTLTTNERGYLNFAVSYDKLVTITFEKDGYIAKKMVVDAKEISQSNKKSSFEFIMALKKKKRNVNYDNLNFPVAKINYCKITKKFKFDNAYNSRMKKAYEEISKKIVD